MGRPPFRMLRDLRVRIRKPAPRHHPGISRLQFGPPSQKKHTIVAPASPHCTVSNTANTGGAIKTLLHTIAGLAILVVSEILTLLLFRGMSDTHPIVATVGYAIVAVALAFALVYLYSTKVLKRPLGDFRVRRPKNLGAWIGVAVLLAAAVSCFFIFVLPGTFTVKHDTPGKIAATIVYSILVTGLASGIIEDLIFRGYLMRLFEDRRNKIVGALIPSIIFAAMHIGRVQNPSVTDMLLVLVGGTVFGIMLSVIAYMSNSFWASASVHCIWNIIVDAQIIGVGSRADSGGTSLYTYSTDSTNELLTGGKFGIEVSLPAILAYCIVIAVCVTACRRTAAKTAA